jgi:hypothetical protein
MHERFIFFASLKELNGPRTLVNIILTVTFGFFITSRGRLQPPQPFAKAAYYYFLITWIVMIYFRYYFHPSVWPTWLKLTA